MKKLALFLLMIISFCPYVKAEESSAFLSDLNITNGYLVQPFDKYMTTYTVVLDEDAISLGIEYLTEDPYASLTISGNDMLEEGSVVSIKVVNGDDSKNITYQLVVAPEEDAYVFDEEDSLTVALEVPAKEKRFHLNQEALVGSICFLVILSLFYFLFLRKKKKKKFSSTK